MWFQKLTVVFLSQLTSLRLIPELREAWACLCNEYRKVPGENLSKEEHFSGRNRGRYKFSTNFFLGLKVFFLSKMAPRLAAKFMVRRTHWCLAHNWQESRDESPSVTSGAAAVICLMWLVHFYFLFTYDVLSNFPGFRDTKILV